MVICVVLAVMGFAVEVGAQESPPTFELSFPNPGARSMGFGGAFVALADDATAAFANPAGLVQLVRPELFFELRARYTTQWSVDASADIVSELTGLSFISFVLPKGDWAFAFNGHRMANFDFSPTEGGGLEGVLAASTRAQEDPWPVDTLDIVRYAFSVAYRAVDQLAVGVGVSYFKGTFELTCNEEDTLGGMSGSLSMTAPGGSPTVRSTETGLTGGILWSPTEQLRVGAFYRQGPRFRVVNAAGVSGSSEEPGGGPGDSVLAFPDTWGAGAAYRSPGGSLTLAMEWDHVAYSSFLLDWRAAQLAGGRLGLDDGDEVHVGFEWAFLRRSPLLALRAGLWLEPDHQIHYLGDDPALHDSYPEGDTRVHGAFGIGVAFRHFQIDFGVDLSDPINAASLSVIYGF